MTGRKKRKANKRVLLPLPQCDGPKLEPFCWQNAPIEWLQRLDHHIDDSLADQGEAYVFKVRIKGKLYALKVFQPFDIETTRFYWGAVLPKGYSPRQVAQHTDPFFAECRAYGRIQEGHGDSRLKKAISVPCHGYLLLEKQDRDILEDYGLNFSTAYDIYIDDLNPSQEAGQQPIRAIVKDFDASGPGISQTNIKTTLQNIRKLNGLQIYTKDIHIDNFIDGKFVDFGAAWTEPHCYINDTLDAQEACDAKYSDLVMFDEMVQKQGFITSARGMRNWEYCRKLRSQTRRSSR